MRSSGPPCSRRSSPDRSADTIGLLWSAPCEATRSLECDLDTLRAAACSAHLAGHRLRLRPRRAQSSCRRRDPAPRGLWCRAAARTAIGQGDHATGRRDGRRNAASAHAEWIAPRVSREERRPVVHLDSVCPRSDRWTLGYPRGPSVARSAGRVITQRRVRPPKEVDMHDMKERLSVLWIFALLNYLYADVIALWAILGSPPADTPHLGQLVLAGSAILMEIPIAM